MAYDTRFHAYEPARSRCIQEAIQKALRYNYGNPVPDIAMDEKMFAFRLRDQTYAGSCNEYGDPGPSTMQIEIIAYPIIKRTACGIWIAGHFEGTLAFRCHQRKFVNLQANKRFAVDSVEGAIDSFAARKRRQRSIYLARARRAEDAIIAVARGYL